ncbi:MAG: iron export ABC transporter permease subunit FetB [Thiotrichales bacterium]
MPVIPLSPLDLALAAVLVGLVALFSWRLGTGQARPLLVAALRTVVQLLLVGLVLEVLFAHARLVWVLLLMAGMLLMAGYEVTARQKRRFRGRWGYGLGTASMFISTFCVMALALLVLVQPQPWYQPQYAIPLLGMLLGNSMTGTALALDRLTEGTWRQREQIEARLMLGHAAGDAIASVRTEALRSGLMPIINAMAAAGVVSLPGMMTGQILAGSPPLEAVKYQILILFLIAAASGLATLIAVRFGARRLFDERQRLVLERLAPPT